MLTLCGMSVRLRGLVLGALVGFGLGSCDREEEDPWEPDPQLCTSEDALTLYQRPEIVVTRSGLANFGAFGFADWVYEDIGWVKQQ